MSVSNGGFGDPVYVKGKDMMSSEAPEPHWVDELLSDFLSKSKNILEETVAKAIAERDAEIANLKGEVEHWKRLYDDSLFDIAAERQRARLPEDLVKDLAEVIELYNEGELSEGDLIGMLCAILSAVEQKP